MKNHWEICYKNISLQYEVLSAVEHMNLTQLKIALDFWQKYSCCLGTGGNGNHHEFMCHFKQSKFSEQSQHLICICLQAKDGCGYWSSCPYSDNPFAINCTWVQKYCMFNLVDWISTTRCCNKEI